jgi:hypothetical protein
MAGRNILLVFLSMLIPISCIPTHSSTHIVNGTTLGTENPGHWNTVGISKTNEGSPADSLPFCSGSLVAPRFVLTAAHCIKAKPQFVFFHNTNSAHGPMYRPIARTIVHPDYIGGDTFDIALVEYTPETRDSNSFPPGFQPMSIMNETSESHLEKSGIMMLVGYGREGRIRTGEYGKKLATDVRIHKIWRDTFLGLGLITYQDNQKRGACSGDSGGPAYAKSESGDWNIVGVTHGIRGRYFGFTRLPTCEEGMGIYTYAPAFTKWITATTQGVPAPSWNWAENDAPFRTPLELCTQTTRSRSMHHAMFTLANALEDATEVPMSNCENFASAFSAIKRLETTNVITLAPLLKLVGQMPNLEWLTLADPNSPQSPLLPTGLFKSFSKLKKLTLKYVALESSHELQNLKIQDLELVHVKNLSLESLGSLKLLSNLRFIGNESPRLDILGTLPALANLEAVNVTLTSEDLSAISNNAAFPRLRMVSFSEKTKMDYEALLHLAPQFAELPAHKRLIFPKPQNAQNTALVSQFLTSMRQLGAKASISFY